MVSDHGEFFALLAERTVARVADVRKGIWSRDLPLALLSRVFLTRPESPSPFLSNDCHAGYLNSKLSKCLATSNTNFNGHIVIKSAAIIYV